MSEFVLAEPVEKPSVSERGLSVHWGIDSEKVGGPISLLKLLVRNFANVQNDDVGFFSENGLEPRGISGEWSTVVGTSEYPTTGFQSEIFLRKPSEEKPVGVIVERTVGGIDKGAKHTAMLSVSYEQQEGNLPRIASLRVDKTWERPGEPDYHGVDIYDNSGNLVYLEDGTIGVAAKISWDSDSRPTLSTLTYLNGQEAKEPVGKILIDKLTNSHSLVPINLELTVARFIVGRPSSESDLGPSVVHPLVFRKP